MRRWKWTEGGSCPGPFQSWCDRCWDHASSAVDILLVQWSVPEFRWRWLLFELVLQRIRHLPVKETQNNVNNYKHNVNIFLSKYRKFGNELYLLKIIITTNLVLQILEVSEFYIGSVWSNNFKSTKSINSNPASVLHILSSKISVFLLIAYYNLY